MFRDSKPFNIKLRTKSIKISYIRRSICFLLCSRWEKCNQINKQNIKFFREYIYLKWSEIINNMRNITLNRFANAKFYSRDFNCKLNHKTVKYFLNIVFKELHDFYMSGFKMYQNVYKKWQNRNNNEIFLKIYNNYNNNNNNNKK